MMSKKNFYSDFQRLNRATICIADKTIPVLNPNSISVCLSSSNEYSPFLCVTICSIIQNSNPNTSYEIIVLTTDLSVNNRNIIAKEIEKTFNFTIRFVNVSSHIKGKNFYTWAHFTPFTYYRLLIPDLFCNYRKLIYLDCDIVVHTDIAKLFEIDVEGYLIAAVQDTHVLGRLNPDNPYFEPSYYRDVLGIDELGYFQAGVMVFNIKEFAKRFQHGELIGKACTSHYRWLDQDFFNVECRGLVKYLPNAWNVMVFNNPKNIDEEYLSEEYYQDYIRGKSDPRIIHYIGRSLPCFMPHVDMHQYFWMYARNTPYYELIISKMIGEAEKRMKRQQTLKQRIKEEWLMPMVNKLFPVGSKRRKIFKSIYFKLRGWNID